MSVTGTARIPVCSSMEDCSPLVRVRVDVPNAAAETRIEVVARSPEWPEGRYFEPGSDVWLTRHRHPIDLELRLKREGTRSLGQPDLSFQPHSIRVTVSTLQDRVVSLDSALRGEGILGIPAQLAALENTHDPALPGALALGVHELPEFQNRSQAYLAIQSWLTVHELGEVLEAVALPGSDDEVLRRQSLLAAQFWSRRAAKQYLPTVRELLSQRRALLETLPLEALAKELLRLARSAAEFSDHGSALMADLERVAAQLPEFPEAESFRQKLLALRELTDADLMERAFVVSRLRQIHSHLIHLEQSWQDEVAVLEAELAQYRQVNP